MDKLKVISCIKHLIKSGKLDGRKFTVLYFGKEYYAYNFGVDGEGCVLFSYTYKGSPTTYHDHKLEWIVDNFVFDLFKLMSEGIDHNLF